MFAEYTYLYLKQHQSSNKLLTHNLSSRRFYEFKAKISGHAVPQMGELGLKYLLMQCWQSIHVYLKHTYVMKLLKLSFFKSCSHK